LNVTQAVSGNGGSFIGGGIFVMAPSLTNMTNDLCAALCSDFELKFALTTNGTSCGCLLAIGNFVPSTLCNIACSGNQNQTCGSSNSSVAIAATVTGTELNCISTMLMRIQFNNPTTCPTKVLQKCSLVSTTASSTVGFGMLNYPFMTNDYCSALCADIEEEGLALNVPFSGTFNGTNCVCLAQISPTVNSASCTTQCIGDKSQICGGACLGGATCSSAFMTVSNTPVACQSTKFAGLF